jgi:uncharacterized membrane protein
MKIRRISAKIIDVFALMAVVTTFILAAVYYHQLPDLIPNRFGFDGMPVVFGARKTIWMLPVLGAMIFLVLTLIGLALRFVEREEHRTREVLELAASLLRWVKLIFCILFLYLALVGVVIYHISRIILKGRKAS